MKIILTLEEIANMAQRYVNEILVQKDQHDVDFVEWDEEENELTIHTDLRTK